MVLRPPLALLVEAPLHGDACASPREELLGNLRDEDYGFRPAEVAALNAAGDSLEYVPSACYFEAPYGDRFAYGYDALNLGHPVTRALLRLDATITRRMEGDAMTLAERALVARIGDAILAVWQRAPFPNWCIVWSTFAREMETVWKLAAELGVTSGMPGEGVVPEISEFVPGTAGDEEYIKNHPITTGYEVNGPFGQPVE